MNYPRLVADIGGTNARFAIEARPFELSHMDVLPCADYETLLLALRAYLDKHDLALPEHVGIAIANPVHGDRIQMTNHHWRFSINDMREELGVKTLQFMNDFTAQALAVTQMSAENITLLNGESEKLLPTDKACAVIGPGTGLGVSGLIPDGRGSFVALAGEGGHVTFSPADEIERDLLQFAAQAFGHVSAERLLQGEGLTLIYRFLAEREGLPVEKHTPAAVTRGALEEHDPLCVAVLSRYCAILGGFCADVALTLGAVGGVYITGGIIPRFVDFVRHSDFRQRFEAKGRFVDYLRAIPVYVVEHEQPGLLGAAVGLNNALKY